MTPTRPISTRPQFTTGSGCATVAMALFGLLFLSIGAGVGWFFGAKPIARAIGTRTWQPARCQILTNQIAYSSDGDTSRVNVTYRYAVNGRSFTSSRYDFSTGYDNFSWDAKSSFVSENPPGKEIDCFVDPEHPDEAVIDRSVKWSYYFPLIFAAMFGLPGLFVSGAAVFVKRRVADVNKVLAGAPAPSPAAAWASGSGSASPSPVAGSSTAFAPRGPMGEMTFADVGPVVLAPEASPMVKLLVLLFVFLFWNGIVGLFTWLAWGQREGGIAMKLFLIPFQAVGLFILWGLVYQVMALFNPRPILTLPRRTMRLGESLPLQWRIRGGASRIGTLRIELTGREEATYSRGTNTMTDKHEFYKASIVETSESSRIESGMTTVNIPARSMHSFKAEHNKIVWTLKVTGSIRTWPDLDESFDIIVTP